MHPQLKYVFFFFFFLVTFVRVFIVAGPEESKKRAAHPMLFFLFSANFFLSPPQSHFGTVQHLCSSREVNTRLYGAEEEAGRNEWGWRGGTRRTSNGCW